MYGGITYIERDHTKETDYTAVFALPLPSRRGKNEKCCWFSANFLSLNPCQLPKNYIFPRKNNQVFTLCSIILILKHDVFSKSCGIIDAGYFMWIFLAQDYFYILFSIVSIEDHTRLGTSIEGSFKIQS